MARPLLKFRYKRVNGSLLMYKEGEYVGSISDYALYCIISEKNQ